MKWFSKNLKWFSLLFLLLLAGCTQNGSSFGTSQSGLPQWKATTTDAFGGSIGNAITPRTNQRLFIDGNATSTGTLVLSGLNCSGLGGGGTLTTLSTGQVVCANDDSGGVGTSYATFTFEGSNMQPVSTTPFLFPNGLLASTTQLFSGGMINYGNSTTSLNLTFMGEIMPDGLECANGQILKRTGANNWDCAADDNSGGGGYAEFTSVGSNQQPASTTAFLFPNGLYASTTQLFSGGFRNYGTATTTNLYLTGVAANSWLAVNGINKVIATSTQPLSEVPTGTVNGANTVFTLTKTPADTDDLIISANGSVLRNGTDFTLAGKTITFTIAPETNWLLFAHYQAYPSGLQFGLNATVVTKTTTYTITSADGTILGDATSAAFTLTLPTAVGNSGKIFVIKKIDSSVNAVTVDGNGSQTIDGALTAVLTTQYESMSIISNGSNFLIF